MNGGFLPPHHLQPTTCTCHTMSHRHGSTSASPPSHGGGRHPTFRGVRKRKSTGKWVSEIRQSKTPNRIWLSTFPTAEMAAVAYDVAGLALKGKEAELNFPNFASSLPVPASAAAADIPAVAASAAAAAGAAMDSLCGGGSVEKPADAEPEVEAPVVVEEFVDEELIFDLPNVLSSMAEGMLMSPPRLGFVEDGDHYGGTLSDDYLWNYK